MEEIRRTLKYKTITGTMATFDPVREEFRFSDRDKNRFIQQCFGKSQ